MPTLWDEVQNRLGSRLSDRARRFLELRGAEQRWRVAPAAERLQIEWAAVQMVESLRAAGYEAEASISDAEPRAKPGITDPRWKLWQDLRDAAGVASGWQPVLMRRVFDVTTDNPAVPADRVELSFDHRLSRAAVVASLEKLWPRLTEARWIRPTRTMDSRAAALVRFVCLEHSPGTPWRQLMTEWNRRYPHWKHASPRDFESRFRRHEEQLTGYSRGLDWFYDPDARQLAAEDLTATRLPELSRLPQSVQRHFMRRVRPILYEGQRSMGRAARATKSLLDQGLTPEEIFGDDWDMPPGLPADIHSKAMAAWREAIEDASKYPDDSDIGESKTE